MMLYPGGKIMDERGSSLRGMIALSVLVHVAILAVLIFSPSLPTPKMTFGPAYSVQLVSMPMSVSRGKGDDTSLKDLMTISPASQPQIKKESVETLSTIPLAPVETKKAVNIDNALESIRKNVQSAAKTAPSPSGEKQAAKAASSLPSPSGRQGDGEVNAAMQQYYAIIWSKIKGLWSLPQGMLPRGNSVVVIHVQILRDGTAVNVDYEKRSGNRYFDESALRTVKKAAPFPPLPEGVRENGIDVGIRFHSSEFR